MRAPRLHLVITAAVAVLVLGACGSSGGGDGDAGSGNGNGDSPTTTAVSPAHVGINEQTGGPDSTGANGGGADAPILTDVQSEAALCEFSGTAVADEEHNSSGSGDAKNFAAVAEGLGDTIDERCEENAGP